MIRTFQASHNQCPTVYETCEWTRPCKEDITRIITMPIDEFGGQTLTDLRGAEMEMVDKTIYIGWTQQKIDFEYLRW